MKDESALTFERKQGATDTMRHKNERKKEAVRPSPTSHRVVGSVLAHRRVPKGLGKIKRSSPGQAHGLQGGWASADKEMGEGRRTELRWSMGVKERARENGAFDPGHRCRRILRNNRVNWTDGRTAEMKGK